MTIFNCLNSHEYFLRMSVTGTSLPELRNLLIFSVKTELSWFSKEMIPWLSCVCQSSSKISLFVLVLWLLVTLVSFAAVIWVVTQCSSLTSWGGNLQLVGEERYMTTLITASKETIVTSDCLPNTFEFLTHAQHKMSSRLAKSTFRFPTYLGRSKETLLAE